MKLKLINDTYYKDIRIEFSEREHFLNKGENVFENIPDNFQLKVNVYDKSKVYFWSMILFSVVFFDFINADEIGSAKLMCNSTYTISAIGDECVIKLAPISAYAKKGVSYASVFLDTQAKINSISYNLSDKESAKKKFVKRNLQLILSATVLFVLAFLLNVGIGLGVGAVSLFFTIPCFIRLFKADKIFSDKEANFRLNKETIKA